MAEQLRVMLVDDDPNVASVFQPLLMEAGYEVISVLDGPSALDILPRAEPDVFILDIMMPELDGFELAAKIRMAPGYLSTPIIFMTALDSKKDIQKAYTTGGSVCLTKPVTIDRLVRNIRVFEQMDGLKPKEKKFKIDEIKPAKAKESSADESRHGWSRYKSAPSPKTPRPDTKSDVSRTPIPQSKPENTTPRPQPPRKPSPASTPPTLVRHSQLPRVLVVEDDEAVYNQIEEVLDQHYEIVVVGDAMQAIKKINDYQPDMFIIDFLMPKMNGGQFIRFLRSAAATARRPILVISARSNKSEQRNALSLGADAFLPKPFAPELLADKMYELTLKPDFVVISPKNKSLREIVKEEARLELEAEEKRVKDEQVSEIKALQEELELDPFSQEDHVRRKHDVKTDFKDIEDLFKD